MKEQQLDVKHISFWSAILYFKRHHSRPSLPKFFLYLLKMALWQLAKKKGRKRL